MRRRDELLRILSDRCFHSGEALGRDLGISRAAVWKQLQALRRRGIQVDAVRGRGYRLRAEGELLNCDAIATELPDAIRRRLAGLAVHQEIDSTNSALFRGLADGHAAPYVCLAEAQTAGRGRYSRRWHSPYGRNLYLSLLWRFSSGSDSTAGLSLAMGVAVLRTLTTSGLNDVRLKWPNDVMWRGAKLAGILIELRGESHGPCHAVIGVGINIHMSTGSPDIDQPWTDIATALGRPVARNPLAAVLIRCMIEALDQYARQGLTAFMEEWTRHDMLLGKDVSVVSSRGAQTGIARGVDATGALLLERGGRLERHLSGEVSVRPAVVAPGRAVV